MSFNIGNALSGAFQGLAESGGNPFAAAASGAVSGFSGGNSSASSPLAATAATATSGLGSLGLGALDNIVSELQSGSGSDSSVNALAQLAGSMLGSGGTASSSAASTAANDVAPSVGITVPQPSTSAQSAFRSFSSMQPQAQGGGDPNVQILNDTGDSGDGADATAAA